MRAIVLKAVAVTALVFITAVGAVAQGANTAYVPFVVNANATVTAVQGAEIVSITVTANEESVLVLPRGVTSVWNTGGTQGRLNAPLITGSRGNITLRLPSQSYQNAEISLHSVNGKRVLRAKVAALETGNAISRRNVVAGVYMLSVKGTNGNVFTTRLTHGGGNLNISVVFGGENVSPERQLGKKAAAEDGDWEITVAAVGYRDSAYTLRPVVGMNGIQIINLDPASQAQTYTLTIAATSGGTVSPSVGAHTYDEGTSVTVTATASSGYTFKNWLGASTSTNATVNIMIDGNKTLMANFQENDPPTPTITTFVDSRDGKTYKKVTIGTQTWMGQNLNYDIPGVTSDVCYGNRVDSCAKYGRLYNWYMAMNEASSSSLSPSGVQGACPVGWHIPSDAEWTVLTDFVGGASTAGTKLKSTSGWSYDGNGTDNYGFTALPGGYGGDIYSFDHAGHRGYWWSATEGGAVFAWYRSMYGNEDVDWSNYGSRSALFSVRCVQD
jgi:uncharacterized protein (TIGR02145 family)/uncharacterized repeat protein (TIGR02543 family)